ncbi:MAG: 2-amino-4-hydroxy-6-hydroxymethyldihydropteridine diphosphokinase [Marinilabiliaceae bacterium]|nr:2-amino-4-hydroxy-6-hydroxymethyldihydropteridine diphosphokinase [Marinilabiliaceae bacterium]
MNNKVIVSIGSNINAQNNISKAFDLINKYIDVDNITPLEQTLPIGIEEQAEFTNGALIGITRLSFENLRLRLKDIENELGRDRTRPKFGPREIDLDIVEWNGKIVDVDYYTRDFLQRMVKWLHINS